MYDLMAISPGDSATVVTAIATCGILLGSLLGRILNYVLRIQEAITEIKGRTLAIEKDIKDIKAWKETF